MTAATTSAPLPTGRRGGAAVDAEHPPVMRSIVDLLVRNAAVRPEQPALRWHVGHGWRVMPWREYADRVDEVAAGLVELGLQPGERVAILSNNRAAWHIADLAVMSARGVTVPIYQTSSSSQVAYTLAHSEARFCFVEDPSQLAKVLLRRHELPQLERVFLFEGTEGLDDSFVGHIDHLCDLGQAVLQREPATVSDRRNAITEEDLATIVYTSGTTGPPKGTMLTHHNIRSAITNITAVVPIGPSDRFLSFLPLSHIAERTVSHFGQIVSGGETWFAQSLASVPDDLAACRPTVFFAVPRVWEKFHEAIVEQLERQPLPMRMMLERYLDLGCRLGHGGGRRLSIRERTEHALLDRTMGRMLRHKLGLDRARFLVSGAAPIHPDLLRWFRGIGLDIAEVYGQTEGCGATSINPPGRIRVGTVGRAFPGVELDLADDGEILVRGDNVTTGYFKDESATRELVDGDGWMHTGDLGSLDDDGYLTITGRKKDLIINAAGKNISPQEIEVSLRQEPLISQAVVVGDRRPYLVALLTLDADSVVGWATAHDKIGGTDQLIHDPELREAVDEAVERVNAKHARVEGIKRWALLPHDLTVEEGELTPTLKVKRQVVTDRFADLIDELYAGSGPATDPSR